MAVTEMAIGVDLQMVGEIEVCEDTRWWLAMGILLKLNGGDTGGEDANPLLAKVNDKLGQNWPERISDVHEAGARLLVMEASKATRV